MGWEGDLEDAVLQVPTAVMRFTRCFVSHEYEIMSSVTSTGMSLL